MLGASFVAVVKRKSFILVFDSMTLLACRTVENF